MSWIITGKPFLPLFKVAYCLPFEQIIIPAHLNSQSWLILSELRQNKDYFLNITTIIKVINFAKSINNLDLFKIMCPVTSFEWSSIEQIKTKKASFGSIECTQKGQNMKTADSVLLSFVNTYFILPLKINGGHLGHHLELRVIFHNWKKSLY